MNWRPPNQSAYLDLVEGLLIYPLVFFVWYFQISVTYSDSRKKMCTNMFCVQIFCKTCTVNNCGQTDMDQQKKLDSEYLADSFWKTKLIKKIIQPSIRLWTWTETILQFTRKVPAGPEINFLAHWPRQLVGGKIHWPTARIKYCLFVSHICLSQYFTEIIRHVENKLKEDRANFN